MTNSATTGDEGTRWISLRHACALVGVNQSTVRRWADDGQIRSFRTPGGHRRLAEADLLALTGVRPALETAAVTRIRRQLHSRGDSDWYSTIEEDDREGLRQLGRRLVELVSDYLERRRARSVVEHEVDEIGRAYGARLFASHTPLPAAIQGFTFFRKSLDETAKRVAARGELPADEASRARDDIATLADRVLIGVAEAYDAATSRRS